MNYNLLISLIIIIIAQTLTYFQLQGQFIWDWAKHNSLLLALFGFPISIFFIYFTKYCAQAFGGEVWPGRLIGFSVGAIVFAILSHYVMQEPFTIKTVLSLVLALLILIIQIFL